MLSIIVTWRDRYEVDRTVAHLLELASQVGGDLTFVNYGGSGELLDELLGVHRPHVNVIDAGEHQYFNKARAQNIGAYATEHPVMFFCDCDVIPDADSIVALVERIAAGPGSFGTLARVRESQVNARGARNVVRFGYELRISTANGRELTIVDHEEDANDGSRHAPGLLLVRRTDFEAIDGFNSQLIGWGWEDQDMIARLTLGAGLQRLCEGMALHLSHDDEARVAHYPVQDRWESRDRMFRQALRNYDRNDFLGTYSSDVGMLTSGTTHLRWTTNRWSQNEDVGQVRS